MLGRYFRKFVIFSRYRKEGIYQPHSLLFMVSVAVALSLAVVSFIILFIQSFKCGIVVALSLAVVSFIILFIQSFKCGIVVAPQLLSKNISRLGQLLNAYDTYFYFLHVKNMELYDDV